MKMNVFWLSRLTKIKTQGTIGLSTSENLNSLIINKRSLKVHNNYTNIYRVFNLYTTSLNKRFYKKCQSILVILLLSPLGGRPIRTNPNILSAKFDYNCTYRSGEEYFFLKTVNLLQLIFFYFISFLDRDTAFVWTKLDDTKWIWWGRRRKCEN